LHPKSSWRRKKAKRVSKGEEREENRRGERMYLLLVK
jgi:hypothetical protein